MSTFLGNFSDTLAYVFMHTYDPTMRITPKPQALTEACKTLGCSRDELARRMGVATATAYRIDAGRTEPSPKFIAALMTLTEKPFEDLFDILEGEVA